MYNRLKINDDRIGEKLGYTEGYGSFQIHENLYRRILNYLNEQGANIARGYGGGPSKKLKLIQLACRKLNITDYSYHGIKREYYLFPLVYNLKQIIGNQEQPTWKNYKFNQLVDYWKKRWLNRRVENSKNYKTFNIDDYIGSLLNLFDEGKA
jgi:hypothetical protein